MSNDISRKSSCNSISQLLNRLTSLDHHKDGWEYIEALDREFGAGEEDEFEFSFFSEVESELDDQEDDKLSSISSSSNFVKIKYTILSKAEILQLLEDKITKVSTVLMLSRNDAAIILQRFKWRVDRTNDEWVTCEEKVRKEVGLFVRPVVEIPTDASEITCKKCHADFRKDSMLSVSCGHQICCPCWEGYITEAISDGSRCLTLRCPEQTCDAAVGFHLIKLLSSDNDKIEFENHLFQSYVNVIPEAKQCPAPACNFVVFSSNAEEGMVTCQCLHSFCWSCSREAHAPVECSKVDEWMSEAPLRSENWYDEISPLVVHRSLANAVICSICTMYEESVCKNEYCSECCDEWCTCKQEINVHCISPRSPSEDDNNLREYLKKSLEKYNHYYERWTACESSRADALSDLKMYQDLNLEHLPVKFGISSTKLDFLIEALRQIVECWLLLKWTYGYGYYIPDDEQKKKQLLEFLQDEATSFVTRLHKNVEELKEFLKKEVLFLQFEEFRRKMIMLTRVIRNYFRLLAEGLMDGLSEVESISTFSPRLTMSGERGESSCDLEIYQM